MKIKVIESVSHYAAHTQHITRTRLPCEPWVTPTERHRQATHNGAANASDEPTPPPERLLALAVIERALLDAAGGRISNNDSQHTQRWAQEWLTGNSRGFNIICAIAGIEPDFLRDRFSNGDLDVSKISPARNGRNGYAGATR